VTTTIADIVSAARVRLQEATARAWEDSGQLTRYASLAEQWYAGYFAPKPGVKLFRYLDTFTVAANATTFDLRPAGTPPTGLTKNFSRLVNLYLVWENGEWIPLKFLDDTQEHRARNAVIVLSGPVIPRYNMQGDSLLLVPPQAATRNYAIRYIYLPLAKTSGNLETPPEDDDLLVLRLTHYALADARETNTAFEVEHESRIAETLNRLVGREFGSRGERVRSRTARLLYR